MGNEEKKTSVWVYLGGQDKWYATRGLALLLCMAMNDKKKEYTLDYFRVNFLEKYIHSIFINNPRDNKYFIIWCL